MERDLTIVRRAAGWPSCWPREAVFAAFLDQLAQPPQRQVVVVEDAHWADERPWTCWCS